MRLIPSCCEDIKTKNSWRKQASGLYQEPVNWAVRQAWDKQVLGDLIQQVKIKLKGLGKFWKHTPLPKNLAGYTTYMDSFQYLFSIFNIQPLVSVSSQRMETSVNGLTLKIKVKALQIQSFFKTSEWNTLCLIFLAVPTLLGNQDFSSSIWV